MKEKTFSYQQITTETEAFIRDEMEALRKILASDPFDTRSEHHKDTAAGAYFLWLRMTAGFQQKGDNERLLAITFPNLQE